MDFIKYMQNTEEILREMLKQRSACEKLEGYPATAHNESVEKVDF